MSTPEFPTNFIYNLHEKNAYFMDKKNYVVVVIFVDDNFKITTYVSILTMDICFKTAIPYQVPYSAKF